MYRKFTFELKAVLYKQRVVYYALTGIRTAMLGEILKKQKKKTALEENLCDYSIAYSKIKSRQHRK